MESEGFWNASGSSWVERHLDIYAVKCSSRLELLPRQESTWKQSDNNLVATMEDCDRASLNWKTPSELFKIPLAGPFLATLSHLLRRRQTRVTQHEDPATPKTRPTRVINKVNYAESSDEHDSHVCTQATILWVQLRVAREVRYKRTNLGNIDAYTSAPFPAAYTTWRRLWQFCAGFHQHRSQRQHMESGCRAHTNNVGPQFQQQHAV